MENDAGIRQMISVNSKIKESLRRNFSKPQRFVLGVSGGIDSQCLLKSFPHVAIQLGHSVEFAIGCNHGLRPEADSELILAQSLANSIKIPFKKIDLNLQYGPNIQERARDARYKALRDAANGAYIVVAHHADDKAETVLMRLVRGKNLGSLAVMPELNGDIYRPMLEVWRSDIERQSKYWKLNWAEDPSNKNMKYTRSKIRHELMPYLTKMNPKIRERLIDISNEISNAKA